MAWAFEEGAEYLVRVNDDTEFKSKRWITAGVKALLSLDPPNLGVVGPTCPNGNKHILTHDMVHRTHLKIFDSYYPSVFGAWWVDDWITKVYGAKTKKLPDWVVHHHTTKHGTRYSVEHSEGSELTSEITKGAARIAEWAAVCPKTPCSRFYIRETCLRCGPRCAWQNQACDETQTTEPSSAFTVVVVVGTNGDTLKRLLLSLQVAQYVGDRIDILLLVDQTATQSIRIGKTFHFTHGTISMVTTTQNKRDAIFQETENICAAPSTCIIMTDSHDVAPTWYKWLRSAWETNMAVSDVAGVTLERQSLVPQEPHQYYEIVNNHEPFLFKLVGSVAYSPHPDKWPLFINWLNTINIDLFDVGIPSLVTAKWWHEHDRGESWAPYYQYFARHFELYTLYVNPRDGGALAVDFAIPPIFPLTTIMPETNAMRLSKYNWDGTMVTRMTTTSSTLSECAQSAIKPPLPEWPVSVENVLIQALCPILPGSHVLEWGSGETTLAFASFTKSWDSVETDPARYAKIQYVARTVAPTAQVYYTPSTWSGIGDGTAAEFEAYLTLPTSLGKEYDIILLTGRARVACAMAAKSLLAKNGRLIMHNWERPQYKDVLTQGFTLLQEFKHQATHAAILGAVS